MLFVCQTLHSGSFLTRIAVARCGWVVWLVAPRRRCLGCPWWTRTACWLTRSAFATSGWVGVVPAAFASRACLFKHSLCLACLQAIGSHAQNWSRLGDTVAAYKEFARQQFPEEVGLLTGASAVGCWNQGLACLVVVRACAQTPSGSITVTEGDTFETLMQRFDDGNVRFSDLSKTPLAADSPAMFLLLQIHRVFLVAEESLGKKHLRPLRVIRSVMNLAPQGCGQSIKLWNCFFWCSQTDVLRYLSTELGLFAAEHTKTAGTMSG